MNKKVYLIRHCQANGQNPEADLTSNGYQQSVKLKNFFLEIDIDRIISSPFQRTIQSIKPISHIKHIEIEIDERLSERKLSEKDMPDWLGKLKITFLDFTIKFDGGESSQEATDRILAVIENVLNSNNQNTVIATHGNILSLLLMYYNKDFKFEDWIKLSNPDVFLLEYKNDMVTIKHLWNEIKNVDNN